MTGWAQRGLVTVDTMADGLINKLEAMLGRLDELDAKLIDPQVASRHDELIAVSRTRAAIEPICARYRDYRAALGEAEDVKQMLEGESDPEMREMARGELAELESRAGSLLEQIREELVTTDDRAVGSVILEIRAGVGGDEAGIWAGDLLEMYQRYASDQGWSWEPMSFNASEMGGCKAAIVTVAGEGVWQHLGFEGGTHCVKRVPATEAQGRIHTSTATVAVLPEPEKLAIDIAESDVEIDITTSQGPGGQNVNKVATAVKMRHIPTGIEVRMQDTKSQRQNRVKAWQLLRARVYEHEQRQIDADRAASRSKMIGRGGREERIRTYRYKDNLAVDHRINQSFNLQEVMAGNLAEMIAALIEQDKAARLAAL
ncbi:MAG: peptide chain release factor 1 [Planctomycetaceae bacterium]|nr:peptide chain release factor 1 [Planctomycetaceae bacterium]